MQPFSIYVSSPFHSIGDPTENFIRATKIGQLIDQSNLNIEAVVPHQITSFMHEGYLYRRKIYDPYTEPQILQMMIDLLKTCNGVLFCHNWEKSKGCLAESDACKENNIPFETYDGKDFQVQLIKLISRIKLYSYKSSNCQEKLDSSKKGV